MIFSFSLNLFLILPKFLVAPKNAIHEIHNASIVSNIGPVMKIMIVISTVPWNQSRLYPRPIIPSMRIVSLKHSKCHPYNN